MSDPNTTRTTVSNIGVAMFTVADQDAALAFYTEKLGWEVRGDDRFGEHNEMRWLEVAPPEARPPGRGPDRGRDNRQARGVRAAVGPRRRHDPPPADGHGRRAADVL